MPFIVAFVDWNIRREDSDLDTLTELDLNMMCVACTDDAEIVWMVVWKVEVDVEPCLPACIFHGWIWIMTGAASEPPAAAMDIPP